ncbi:hypothetical protein CASFOL_004871 [Castilleja foliolosa]|uniref:Calmodulin-binding domain-containing protein n=1 Tax=Castilleja foliolosa TaxID=1961234 RepID=A0ABD3ECE7_9LAMI
MVQKKIPQNLILLQSDQDVKNIKGPDLKKKMKKSGSIKRQEQANQPRKPKPPPPAAAAAATPNYMKSTTSSDARKEVSPKKSPNNSKFTLPSATKTKQSRASFSAIKKETQFVFREILDSQRSTCSSTLKDSNFPAYLSLSPGATESNGTSIVKVCTYTYCSLNGHFHAPLPPLKCFLAARRRAIKSQRSVKLGCLSSPRRVVKDDSKSPRVIFSPLTNEKNEGDGINGSVDQEENGEISVQEEMKSSELQGENVGFDEHDFSELSDMEWENEGSDIKSDIDGGELVESRHVIDDEIVMEEIDKKVNGLVDEFQSDQVSQESFDDEDRFDSDTFSCNDDNGDSTNSYRDELSDGKNQENSTESDFEVAKLKKAKTETEDSGRLVLAITKRNKGIEETDESGAFNPRAPNFLPLELDPEAEKVDLKHQDLDERKDAEEWMVDYELRQIVTKLSSARKRKVALLVEAFEKVTPKKKCELQLRHASAFDQARPMQACS